MNGRIRDDSIAEVRDAADIAALVGEYVSLRPAGGSRLKGLCPFHQEKTPSFTVRPERGAYHCFGCGASGDSIDFLQQQSGLSFTEAVERLAQLAGVQLRYEGRAIGERGALGRRNRLQAATAAAVDFYHRQLLDTPNAQPAREYLARRGYGQDVAARFRIGWAPDDSWQALTDHLRGQGYTPEELTEGGLSKVGSRGLRDAFRGRVLFPIHDVAGDPVAFGGRVLDADAGGPKYLNTAETPIWHKGRTLYGLSHAKQSVVHGGFAVVVEGYTDVISLHAAGVQQAVATCGTALRADHFKVLSRFTNRVVLAFDSDAAGAKAADRGMTELQAAGDPAAGDQAAERSAEGEQASMGDLVGAPGVALSAYVLTMPAGLDPADFVARHGGPAFAELVQDAVPMVRWWLEFTLGQHELGTPEGRVRASQAVLPILRRLPDRQQRADYARWTVQRLHLDEREFLRLVSGGRSRPAQAQTAAAPGTPARRSREGRLECEALKLALQHPEWSAEATLHWTEEWFTTGPTKAAWAALAKAGGVQASLDAVLESAENDTDRRFLRGLALEALAGSEERGYADDVFLRLEELRLTREIDALKSSLQRINPVEASDQYHQVFGDLIALEARRRDLREAAAQGRALSSRPHGNTEGT